MWQWTRCRDQKSSNANCQMSTRSLRFGSILVFHDVTRERELVRMKTDLLRPFSRTRLPHFDSGRLDRSNAGLATWSWRVGPRNGEAEPGGQADQYQSRRHHSEQPADKVDQRCAGHFQNGGRQDPLNFAQMDVWSIIDQAIHPRPLRRSQKWCWSKFRFVAASGGDPDQVVQVIINLISNAVKFTILARSPYRQKRPGVVCP